MVLPVMSVNTSVCVVGDLGLDLSCLVVSEMFSGNECCFLKVGHEKLLGCFLFIV